MQKQVVIERKIYKKRRKWKKKKAKYNLYRNLEKKSVRRKIKRESYKPKIVKIPSLFSLPSEREAVLIFFNSLDSVHYKTARYLFFDFSEVIEISHGAITILLSFIGWLNDQGVRASGNFPDDPDAKEKFEKSGFLEFFKTIGKRSYEKGMNTIVARGEKRTNSELSSKLIRKSTKTVWNIEDKNMKVQGMLIELMANTINHAYAGGKYQKGWYFSVDHIPDENKVKFCFVDNGHGILKTLRKKFPDKIASFIGGKFGNNIIKRAFDGEFGSRTKLSNRGRGLKAIKKVYQLGYIKSLKVITNNIYYDFENDTAEELKTYFDGTFYFWEIDNTCKR